METINSERLILRNLTKVDNKFIFNLLNTDGWIQFIGNRNINSNEDAVAYIDKILNNQNVLYWVVETLEEKKAIGIISFIKREYLDFHDIGFAFLPEFSKNGYAYEATQIILKYLRINNLHKIILATTVPENIKSISLLERLNFVFDKKITIDNEDLLIYKNSIN